MPGKRTLNDLLALGGAPPPPPAIDINTQSQASKMNEAYNDDGAIKHK